MRSRGPEAARSEATQQPLRNEWRGRGGGNREGQRKDKVQPKCIGSHSALGVCDQQGVLRKCTHGQEVAVD